MNRILCDKSFKEFKDIRVQQLFKMIHGFKGIFSILHYKALKLFFLKTKDCLVKTNKKDKSEIILFDNIFKIFPEISVIQISCNDYKYHKDGPFFNKNSFYETMNNLCNYFYKNIQDRNRIDSIFIHYHINTNKQFNIGEFWNENINLLAKYL